MNLAHDPTDDELKRIETYDLLTRPLQGLIDLVTSLWWGNPKCEGVHGGTWYLATGGWSGNEAVIGALHANHLFWSLYWRRSERGGAYWFDVSRSVPHGHGPVTQP